MARNDMPVGRSKPGKHAARSSGARSAERRRDVHVAEDPRREGTARRTEAPHVEPGAPTIVVDDVHVEYREYVSGRPDDSAGFLRRRTPMRSTRVVQALRGVSFAAFEGEAIGVIGRNGSGKSTLLRAIAGLTSPSRGRVFADGNPALLGVNGALMNDLNGHRNVLLGGLALGLSRAEVADSYDEIVAFADLGDSLDLPMRTYSSGMNARLRFAIATATRHRILMIDEALAVGDAEFRQRSRERIDELRQHAGTVLLVSHSLGQVAETCERVLWIDEGRIRMDGPAQRVVSAYQRHVGA